MIELVAIGAGPTQDLAALEALKNAVRQQTRVMVETKALITGGRFSEDFIVTQSSGYVQGYTIREVKREGDHYVVRVLAKIDEQKLKATLGAQNNTVDGPMLAMAAKQQQPPERDWAAEWDLKDRQEAAVLEFEGSKEVRARYPIEVELYSIRGAEANIHFRWNQPQELALVNPYRMLFVRWRDQDGNVVWSGTASAKGIGWVVTSVPTDPETLARIRKVEVAWD